LVGTEYGFEGVSGQISWKWWVLCWILNLQELVFSVTDWHLEAILSGNELAFESLDVLESILSQVIELNNHALLNGCFLFFAKTASGFIGLHLWKSEESSLHAFNLNGAGDEGVGLWLPHFTEKVDVSTVIFFMGIEPVKGKTSIIIFFQWVVEVLEWTVFILCIKQLLFCFALFFDLFPLKLKCTFFCWFSHVINLVILYKLNFSSWSDILLICA
jgi:hypothetical protein